MRIINIVKQRSSWLIMFTAMTGLLSAQGTREAIPGEENPSDSVIAEDNKINLYFNEMRKDRLSGSTAYIDAESEFERDSRQNLGSAISGKVPGVFDSYNTWGTGNAVVVIDGVPQSAYYYQNINMQEIESIVILKDALSKAMYGALGDQGVILVNTKRGEAGSTKIRVSAQYSVIQPRALPKYLGAADYMEKYNEALRNDGLTTIYSQDTIDMTRNGSNQALYPDNKFYTDDYIRNLRSNTNVFFDVSGGNQNAQFYINTEWSHDNGWLNSDIPDMGNAFNFRGNLDFKINKYMKMGINAVARLSANKAPNTNTDYWQSFATILPNAYPVLWDPNLIADSETRDMVLSEAVLHDGKILGGNSTFANNQIHGELVQNGRINYQQSLVQFNGDLDIDLSFITKGLTASAFAGINFYNTLYTEQQYEYAIYEPVVDSMGVLDTVSIHGSDIRRDQYNTNAGNSTYNRQFNYYGTLGYNRGFGKHEISALGLIYGTTLASEGSFQKEVVWHGGLSVNYTFDRRYVIEGSIMGIGSKKLPEGEKFEPAPAAGIAWIISEEGFMENVTFLNLLKLKASYGISKNDNWGTDNQAYYRYTNTFTRGGSFNYQNGTRNNNELLYSTVQNDIYLQQRKDIAAGIEAALLQNSLHLELGYYQSQSIGNLTQMQYKFPQIVGFENLVFSNYNSDQVQGIEVGLDYTYRISEDFSATIGGNLLNINPTITKIDEPIYVGEDEGLLRKGTATDAMWALVADGLYSESDFNPDGSLVDGLPEPTFGVVQAGDIKYLDQNDDGTIDQLDQRIVGHGMRTQYSAYLDIRYRGFGLYILGVGRLGDTNTRNAAGDYFQVMGDAKYSEYALDAYGPGNMDVNALHPRLTTSRGGNNDRNSSYWVYENNLFSLPTIQLSYQFKEPGGLTFLKEAQIYLRGENLVVMGKNKAYTEVNPYGAPRIKSMVIGIVTSF